MFKFSLISDLFACVYFSGLLVSDFRVDTVSLFMPFSRHCVRAEHSCKVDILGSPEHLQLKL